MLNYSFFKKIIVIIIISIGIGLALNLWLFFQPSSIEASVADFLRLGQPEWLTLIMIVISDSYIMAASIVGAYSLWLLWRSQYQSASILVLALLGLALIEPLKSLFHRSRPEVIGTPVEQFLSSSFPSGHAYMALLLAGALYCAYIANNPKANRLLWLLLPVGYALLVGWSRIYLQAHHPSDVVGGYVAALIVLLLSVECSRLVSILLSKRRQQT